MQSSTLQAVLRNHKGRSPFDLMLTLPCPEETIFNRWGPFQALVAERGEGIRVEKVILERSGKKMFVLMKVVDDESGQ